MVTTTVILQGHIIDSLILAKVLDAIVMLGGAFDLPEVTIGSTRQEVSRVKIHIQAASSSLLEEILESIQPHGARVELETDCTLEPSPNDGVLPDSFYATSHLPTQIRLDGKWIDVDSIEMDLAITVKNNPQSVHTVTMADINKGDLVVTGRDGVRVFPLERPKERDVFGFMEAKVSSERPFRHIIGDVAKRMQTLKHRRLSTESSQGNNSDSQMYDKVLVAGGPAIVHAGGREALAWLIESDFINVLFCGNALAAHDMEASIFGTSLGYNLGVGRTVPHGHEHHLRTINRIRAIGSIQKAVEAGVITDGIMAASVRRKVHVVMAGTIRDDGPLPGVITDSLEAQAAMRAALPGVELVLLVASTPACRSDREPAASNSSHSVCGY